MRSAPVPVLLAVALVAAPAAQAAPAAMTGRVIVSPVGLTIYDHAVGAGGTGAGRTALLMAGYRGTGKNTRHSVIAKVGSIRSLTRTQLLSKHVGEQLQVAVGEDGTAAAAWLEGSRGLRFAIARPGKRFSAVQKRRAQAAGSELDRVFVSGVAVTPNGRAVVTWRDDESAAVAIAEPGKRFGPTMNVGKSRQYRPAVTVGLAGSAVLSWFDTPEGPLPGTPGPGPAAGVVVSTLPADRNTFSTPTTLSSPTYWSGTTHTLGTGPGGAVVAWTEMGQLRVSRQTATGFTAPVSTSVPSTDEQSLAVTTDPDGTVPTLWSVFAVEDDDETITGGTVRASTLTPAGAFTPAEDLSEAGSIPGPPRLVALQDRTLAVWASAKGARKSVVVKERRFGQPWAPLAGFSAAKLLPYSVEAAASKQHAAITWQVEESPSGRPWPLYLWTYDTRSSTP